MRRMIRSAGIISVALATMLMPRPAFAQGEQRGDNQQDGDKHDGKKPDVYSVTALPALPGGTWSRALAINHRGQIVGASGSASGLSHAVLWDHGRINDLDPSGAFSDASDINERGQIVGSGQTASFETHAMLWDDGAIVDLGTLGGSNSSANAINERGQILGSSDTAAGEQHAFLWEDGRMIDLGTLPRGPFSPASIAWDINKRGQAAGVSTTADGWQHAVLWENGRLFDLGTFPGGSFSSAIGIDARGQAVGVSNHVPGFSNPHAALWSNGTITDLTGTDSIARAINKRGQVVGELRGAGDFHAFVWQDGRTTVLPMLPGDTSSIAWDINDGDDIVGESLNASFESTAVVWRHR
jgi:probable HAF family extracellular repeat protein